MRFDSPLRLTLREQVDQLAAQVKSWEEKPKMDKFEEETVRRQLRSFAHTTYRENILVAGVHGGGVFPAVCYGDSFIYFTIAQSAVYTSDSVSKLREIKTETQPLELITWIRELAEARKAELNNAFEQLAGAPISEVVERSDYRALKAVESRKQNDVDVLLRDLIHPHAGDAGNLAIQLRSTGELGLALRLIEGEPNLNYLLVETTFSLPSVTLPTGSLFYEHLKRLCCVEARRRGIRFFGLSKSHGLPAIDIIENLAREKFPVDGSGPAEHWYLRLPMAGIDRWELRSVGDRRLPPAGGVSYLVRFHKNLPTMRLDMDRKFWREFVKGKTEDETHANERLIFEDIDYTSHDQRCYGYPYPVKSSRERASLTKSKRMGLRKWIVDAAVQRGMKRPLFRDMSVAIDSD